MKQYSLNSQKFLSESELKQLEFTLEKNKHKDVRNYLLISTTLAIGSRAEETLAIKKTDLNPSNRTIFVKGLKGSNDGEIPVKKQLFDELWKYAQTIPGDRLFDISYPRLVQIWNEYRPCKKKFHSLRHTFALRIYHKTRDIRLLQLALRHRSINSTMVYADFVYSNQEMRRIV